MAPILILLALFLARLTAGLPIHQALQNTTIHPRNSVAQDMSAHALPMGPTANTPFDPFEANPKNTEPTHPGHRTDGSSLDGDVFRLTKCYCVDTPSRDLPPVYGQYYGSYYGFDYYNSHIGKSYAFNWICASGELETLNAELSSAEYYFLAPKCLSWMEEEKHQCWDTGDGNKFCAEAKKGKDYYYWNGQKRRVHNHPAKGGTSVVIPPVLNDECQRMCQTVPANTPGYMQDAIPSDYEHKINLATATNCTDFTTCGGYWPKEAKQWDTWNYIETYSDQADMCPNCA